MNRRARRASSGSGSESQDGRSVGEHVGEGGEEVRAQPPSAKKARRSARTEMKRAVLALEMAEGDRMRISEMKYERE